MEHNGLIETLILLGAAVLVVPVFKFLRLGSVLGFLMAGLLIGPAGLALITELEEVRQLAELGVVFLLFIIGVELKPQRLWLMRRMVFGMGSAQVLLTAAILTVTLMAMGLIMPVALMLGLGLALSSTAFALQILIDRSALGTTHGRASFAILLLQDLAVVPLLALVPLLAQPESSVGGNVGLAVLEAVGMVLAVIIAGRLLLRPILHRVAQHGPQEIFLATALLLVLGVATLIEHAGMSMAMGAFLAGLLIADSEFRHQIMADIQPFRAILLGLFFMTVGMAVEPAVLLAAPLKVIGLLLLLLLVKIVVLWVVARLFGVERQAARRSALLLGQAGEFGFVLFGAAWHAELLTTDIYQQAILVVALSMVVTPLLDWLAHRPSASEEPREVMPPLPEQGHESPVVIIAGFGRVGARIANLLREAEISYRAIEHRPSLVADGRRNGYHVYYGDAVRAEVLKLVGAEHASIMVVAIDNAEAVEALVTEAHRLYPQLIIHARGHSRRRCEGLLQKGARKAVSDNLETSLQLAYYTLVELGLDGETVERQLGDYRERYYAYLEDMNEEVVRE